MFEETGLPGCKLWYEMQKIRRYGMRIQQLEFAPPTRLAIAYAPADLRAAFALLLNFDDRLANIVGRANEPMIAQMKLAWWREAILREPAARPKGEPIFQLLGDLSVADTDAAMLQLIDSWGLLLSVDEWTHDTLESFGALRSAAIFGSYARWIRSHDDVSAMGEAWALDDLRGRFGEHLAHQRSGLEPVCRTTRRLRPLSILALAATSPSGVRMIWHALTGR